MTDESDHTRLVLIEGQVREIKNAMETQTQATQDLVEAWRSAKTLLAFVQLAAKVGAACAAIWLMGKGLFHFGEWK